MSSSTEASASRSIIQNERSSTRKPEPHWHEPRKTCLTYSPGGHYTEMCRALNGITFTNCYHITFETGRHIGCNRAYFVTHPRRSITRTLANALQSLFILLKEKPELIISTGADVAIPTLVLGRLLGAQTIFVETCGSLKPSLAGRIAYHFSSLFIVQWPDKLNHFPRASLADGPLL